MYKILLTTTDKIEIVNKIKDYILKGKLSPCVQIIRGVESSYLWKEKVTTAKEYSILIKCKKNNLEKIKTFIQKEHNYDVCELISTDMGILNPLYKKWFDENSI